MDIKKMSIEEKVARLSETDKAYVQGYVDRALQNIKQQKKKNAGKKKEGKKKDDDESELEYEHEEGRYDGEI